MTDVGSDEAWRVARQRVIARQAFYVHVVLYVAGNIAMFAVNLVTGGPAWYPWPLGLWFLGLAVHGAEAFGVFPLFGTAWETRLMRRMVMREKRRSR